MKSEHQKHKESLREMRKRLKDDAQNRAHILDILVGEKPEINDDDNGDDERN